MYNPIPVSATLLLLLLASLTASMPAEAVNGHPVGNHNCKGSGACTLVPESACLAAYSAYLTNNISSYTSYTSCTEGVSKGCAAMYKCADDDAYKNPLVDMSAPNATGDGMGISGVQLYMLFQTLETIDGCGPCGSQQLPNPKCWVTVNYCKNCKPSCPGGIAGHPTNPNTSSFPNPLDLVNKVAGNLSLSISTSTATATVTVSLTTLSSSSSSSSSSSTSSSSSSAPAATGSVGTS